MPTRIELHPAQQQIARSKARYRVVSAGRRFGKTLLSVEELLFAAVTAKDANVAYAAPTYAQAREISWDMLLKRTAEIKPRINETRLEIAVPNQYRGYSKITLKGWESIESLRGQRFDFMVLDEVAMYRNFVNTWGEIIRPTLTDKKAGCLFISTPKGFNHWYDLYNKEKIDKDYQSFHFTSYANPYIPKEEIDKARQELSEDSFAQEYLADFRKVSGIVCDWFSRDIHLQPAPRDFINTWHESVDGGYKDPLAHLLIGIDTNETVYVEDGFRQSGLSVPEIAARREEVVKDLDILPGVIDSDDPRLANDLADHDIFLNPVEKIKGDARTFDEALAQKLYYFGKLHNGVSKLYIHPKLTWLIEEIELLMWAEKADKEYLPKWDDHRRYGHHFDGLRALAYFLLTLENPKHTLSWQEPPRAEAIDPLRYEYNENQQHNPWRKRA